jgi:hypothetical protein
MPYNQEILTLEDNGMSAMVKLSEGNPGAASVLVRMIKDGANIDPDDFMGPIGCLLSLDSFGIRGSRIWMLYKDVCKQHLSSTMALLRAVQLGFLNLKDLDHAIDNYGEGINMEDLKNKVKETLPCFNLDIK